MRGCGGCYANGQPQSLPVNKVNVCHLVNDRLILCHAIIIYMYCLLQKLLPEAIYCLCAVIQYRVRLGMRKYKISMVPTIALVHGQTDFFPGSKIQIIWYLGGPIITEVEETGSTRWVELCIIE